MVRSILDKINTANPLLGLADAGLTPSEIKALIIQTLEPFFHDQEILRQLAVEFLAPEAANVGKLVDTPNGGDFLRTVLNHYHAAHDHDPKQCFAIICFWEERLEYANREFWSQALLELPKEDLDLEIFQHECLRNIGGMIEGCIQPLLRECLSLEKMIRGVNDPTKTVDQVTLGNVVSELQHVLPDSDLLKPEPWRIPLNQWRNIAQHKTARVANGRIIATYGSPGAVKAVSFKRSELLDALIATQIRLAALRGGRTIFLFDHFHEAKASLPKIEISAASKIFQLSSSFATQGFRIDSFDLTATEARFVLRDLSDSRDFKRIAHCSQFLASIWLFYRTDRVAIDYVDDKGNTKARMFSTARELAEGTRNNTIDWDCLSQAVHFTK